MTQSQAFRAAFDKAYGGLQPGPADKARILAAASAQKEKKTPLRWAMPAVSFALVALLVCVLAIPGIQTAQVGENALLRGQAAGSGSILLGNTMDLTRGSVTVGTTKTSGYDTIWEKGNGANFPLLLVDGKAYRMLKSTFQAEGLAGEAIGTVTQMTDEPALCDANGIYSNIVEAGETVSHISGMKGAFVCASVNGETRAFQRVSFAGTDASRGETLKSTLGLKNVIRIEKTDSGSITDADTIQSLIDTFVDHAVSYGSAKSSGTCVLFFYKNGLCAQLCVNDDVYSACGAWACPEFQQALDDLFSETEQ